MSPFTVTVSGISPSITDVQLHDFFTFCGQISSIQHHDNGTVTIAFEKSSAAKTALMLDGGALNESTLTVKSDVAHQDDHQPPTPHQHYIEQSDKPRAGIAAEYLAKGYILSDHTLKRAIEMDEKHGFSQRFLRYFDALDKSIGGQTLGPNQTITGKVQATIDAATQHARGVDEQGGYSKSANEYYLKAMKSPLAQQVRVFYTSTSKHILDIHEEASRIASQQKQKAASGENSAVVPDVAAVSEPVESKAAVSEPVADTAEGVAPST